MDPTARFTHLKIILLQYFQFSVFNFQQNKQYPNRQLFIQISCGLLKNIYHNLYHGHT